ncbi:hypothetical protein ACFVTF_26470 [Kitasatospora sp. NPDC057940]|uniref:hypothetical protein n=1 Tax=Kitasatospora sp. NPDC057940 TaxID=3346285 RepID=UPI0036D885AB
MRVHRNRHDRAFVVVPNAAARHDRLSLAAVGLLVRLLSLPDGTPATIERIAEQVEEGKTAVAKAFKALEAAGYLRRQRTQDPETGLWSTQSHVSDLPMGHIPAVGEPEHRNVGDLPGGGKDQGKNLLPAAAPEPDAPKEQEEASTAEDQAAPADAETGQAASLLARLGEHDRRLALGTADVLRLAPLAAEWLVDGHTPAKVRAVLTARLPEQVDAPAALLSYRLTHHRPAKPAPKAAPVDTRARCQQCDAPFPAGVVHSLCKTCALEAGRDEAGPDVAAGLLATIRQRRASNTFAKGARPGARFLPAAA